MKDETLPFDEPSEEPSDETVPFDDPPESPDDLETTIASPGGSKTLTLFLTQKGIAARQVDLKAGGMTVRDGEDDRYAIGDELARGGMGAVLNAKDLNLRRDVAMKVVLNPDKARNAQIVRFVHEAQVTGQLEHPSIVPVYELGVDAQDQVYYTMKYIRGTDLGDILKGIKEGDASIMERYTLSRLLTIFIKACDALAFAHSRNVIHRDLKPDNIMVGDFGEVLIVDWGLAKVLEDSPGDTRAEESGTRGTDSLQVDSILGEDTVSGTQTMEGSIMGTPSYMPPEQADGDIDAMGPLADVYSMGAILYTILTLAPPFTGKSLKGLLQKVRDGEFVAPIQHQGQHPHCPEGNVPPSLSAVTMKAMAQLPKDRYASVQNLQGDVQAYLDGFATTAEEANLWRLVQLFVARHKAMVFVGLTASLVLTAVIAVSFVINVKERRAAVAARGQAVDALNAFETEQARGRAMRKTAAPSMIRAAHTLILQNDLEAAEFQSDLAREYDPSLASAPMLAAQLAIVDGSYDDALEALAAYQKLKPADPHAEQLASICRDAIARSQEDPPTLAFAQTLAKQGAWQLANLLSVSAEEALGLYQERIYTTWGGLNHLTRHVTMRPDGRLLITTNPSNFESIEALQGMPIAELSLRDGKGNIDLAPLRGMPLEKLKLYSTPVNDLSPLAGSPLRDLELYGNKELDDLSPLAGLPLTHLKVSWNKVADLSPLRGASLQTLFIGGLTKLTDLSPLENMPLEELVVNQTGVTSLKPLNTCRNLSSLKLNRSLIGDFAPLRGLSLRTLHLEQDPSNGRGYTIVDLRPLSGMPLKELFLKAPVEYIDVLQAMPLESLSLIHSGAADLSFLKGKALQSFTLIDSPATDLSVLRSMPLTRLEIVNCPKLHDISFLDSLPHLKSLILPDHFNPIPYLEKLPNLKTINKETVLSYQKKRASEKKTP